jgi:hypothetical protein
MTAYTSPVKCKVCGMLTSFDPCVDCRGKTRFWRARSKLDAVVDWFLAKSRSNLRLWFPRLIWAAIVLAICPGSCIFIADNTASAERTYALTDGTYPTPGGAVGDGLIQGLGFGFGDELWTLSKQWNSNDEPAVLRLKVAYEMGAASKRHSSAYWGGVAVGWLAGLFCVIGLIAKIRDW